MTQAMTLKELSSHLYALVNAEAPAYAKLIDGMARSSLRSLNIELASVSKEGVIEAAYNAAKDMIKYNLYHPGGVELIKQFGYLCFWVRKVKPIMGGTKDGKQPLDVNELVSIRMATQLCVKYAICCPEDLPEGGVEAVRARAKAFLNDERRIGYLVHSMRYRTFGPHHYVLILQNIVYGF